MNAADLIIMGSVGLLTIFGLMSGLLKPASGIGGLILGLFLAVHYSGDVAETLAPHIEGDTLRHVSAFIAIVLGVTIASRIAAMLVRKLLAVLMLGWLDHLAGAIAGAAVGIVVAGTVVSVLTGADFAPTRDALASSKLTPTISQVSLVSPSAPWCTSGAQPTGSAEGCTDLRSLFGQVFESDVTDKVGDYLGHDPSELAEVVKGALTGSRQDLTDKVDSLVTRPV